MNDHGLFMKCTKLSLRTFEPKCVTLWDQNWKTFTVRSRYRYIEG